MTVSRKLDWKDISKESYRTYVLFKDDYFLEITIEHPFRLALSENGHRIVNKSGKSFYIPKGWVALYWEGYNKGEPQYDF